MPRNNNSGRGWHGDSSGHAKAGRKGGKVRSSTKNQNSQMQSNQSVEQTGQRENDSME